MLKNIWRFVREYPHLGAVALAITVGLGLDIASYDTWSHWILGITALVSVAPLVWGMIEDLRDGTYGIDVLAATAIVTSVLMREYWAGIVIVLMLTGGEALEDYAEKRAKTELTALLERAPKKAHLLRGNKTVEVVVSEIQRGDKLIIKAGEVVPVDAVIIEGRASFDESSLTGESLPVEKKKDEELLSGSYSIDGAVTVKALRKAEDSQYEQIVKLVRAAASSQSPFVRLADRYSIPFTIISFAIAITAWVVSGHPIRFLEVLVVATPCPLLLGAPIALISGMSRAAKHGIIIKTGSALERLAEAKTFAFDKTGTLTLGKLQVATVNKYSTYTKDQILELAAALEQNSTHVLAKAVVDEAAKTHLKLKKTKNVKEFAGKGLRGTVNGQTVLVGKLELLQEEDVQIPAKLGSASVKQTTIYVAADKQLVGSIELTDEIRKESKETLARLYAAGIKETLMVTGDNKSIAQTIARKLGITNVTANALPADKIRAIESIQKRPVAFVGDGVNDAPVLTASEVGIALGARGSAAASESADVVILLDDISRVASAVEIAKRTFFIAKQSILIGIFISIGLMLVFSTGRFKPVYGAAIQELVDVTVIINALRAHGSFRKNTLPS